MFYRSIFFIGLLLFFVSQNAIAQATGTLTVTATIGSISDCVVDSVTPMIFPNYSPLNSSPDEATASIVVTCGFGMPYDVGIDEGHGPGATENDRMMTEMVPEVTGLLPYGLFKDSNYANNWGDIIGEDTLHMEGNNLPQRLTVYGKIATNKPVEAGVYMDIVAIIVTF